MNIYPGIIVNSVLETDNHDWFNLDFINRKISPERLKELRHQFEPNVDEKEYPFQAPIIVFWKKGMEKGLIMQGHHRFTVCKEDGRNVRFVIFENYRVPTEIQMDIGQDWKTPECIKSYAKQKISSYEVLQKLKDEFPKLTYSVLITFLNGKSCPEKALRHGKLELAEDSAIKAYSTAIKRIEKFALFNKAANRKDISKEVVRAMINAWKDEEFDWNYFLERTKANSKEIAARPEFSSISTYALAVVMIQLYYNYNSRKNYFFKREF